MIQFHESPTLEGPRVRLRNPEPKDAPSLLRLYADPVQMRYMNRPPMTHLEEAEDRLKMVCGMISRGEALEWFLELASTRENKVIGTCSLFHFDAQNQRAELGFFLDRNCQGRGLMNEAARLVIRYGFTILRLHRIEADTDPRNIASCSLLERLGFAREGLLRERWLVADERSDTAFYGLLAREWPDLVSQEQGG